MHISTPRYEAMGLTVGQYAYGIEAIIGKPGRKVDRALNATFVDEAIVQFRRKGADSLLHKGLIFQHSCLSKERIHRFSYGLVVCLVRTRK